MSIPVRVTAAAVAMYRRDFNPRAAPLEIALKLEDAALHGPVVLQREPSRWWVAKRDKSAWRALVVAHADGSREVVAVAPRDVVTWARWARHLPRVAANDTTR